jgi:hypothetical protein
MANTKAKTLKKKEPARRAPAALKNGKGGADGELDAVMTEVIATDGAETAAEELVLISCPYCSEDFEIRVSSAEDGKTRAEECQVCCRPISLYVEWEDGEVEVEVDRA